MKYWKPLSILALAFALILTPACTTTMTDVDGNKVEVFDPVRTENVKLAFETFGKTTVRRVIVENHASSPNVLTYLHLTGQTLGKLRDQKVIDPDIIIRDLDAAISAQGVLSGVPPEAIDAKNFALALYSAFYNNRHQLDLDPEKAAYNVLDVMTTTIQQAVADAVVELGLPPLE